MEKLTKRFLWVLGVALVALGMAACGGPKVKEPGRLDATVQAAPDLNPTPQGRASPLLVRLYELRTPGAFEGADFFSLYEQDSAVLARDLVGTREELRFMPGEQKQLKRELSLDTRYIGIVAAYRDVEHAAWRATIAAPEEATTRVNIHLGRAGVKVTPAK